MILGLNIGKNSISGIIQELLGKTIRPTESDRLTESVTEESAEENPVVQDHSVKKPTRG